MSGRGRWGRVITTAVGSHRKSLVLLLLLAAVVMGCENPQEPSEPSVPAPPPATAIGDALRTLKGQVAALVSEARLDATDGHALQGTLDAAAQLLASNEIQAATDAIRRLRTQLTDLVNNGRILRADVRTMLAGVRCLLTRLDAS